MLSEGQCHICANRQLTVLSGRNLDDGCQTADMLIQANNSAAAVRNACGFTVLPPLALSRPAVGASRESVERSGCWWSLLWLPEACMQCCMRVACRLQAAHGNLGNVPHFKLVRFSRCGQALARRSHRGPLCRVLCRTLVCSGVQSAEPSLSVCFGT